MADKGLMYLKNFDRIVTVWNGRTKTKKTYFFWNCRFCLGTPYELSIHTRDIADAGTNAQVYVILYGEEKEENGNVQQLTSGKVSRLFERNILEKLNFRMKPSI